MKYTLSLTHECNLRCSYCYIDKHSAVMSPELAEKIIDEIFRHTPAEENVDIGFFGGEPLLEFELLKTIVGLIENHPLYEERAVVLSITTNGTIFNRDIGEFLAKHGFVLCISCDGPSWIHDSYRRFKNGQGSFAIIKKNILLAKELLPRIWINTVYHPRTLDLLPKVIDYFASLRVDRIYLNPDFSANWTEADAALLPAVYGEIGKQYVELTLKGRSQYISLIDTKLSVIVKDGYAATDRCRMGKGEFAFSATGNIYPCERLIGADEKGQHCIGHIESGLSRVRACTKTGTVSNANTECANCSLAIYCMNWCGCSNYFSTGHYSYVGPFLCASEKAAIHTALQVFQALEEHYGENVFQQIIDNSSKTLIKEAEDVSA